MPNFNLTNLTVRNPDPIDTELILTWNGDLSEFSFFVTGRQPNLRAALWFKEATSRTWARGANARRITQNVDVYLTPVSDPTYTGSRVLERRSYLPPLTPETTYDLRFYVWDANSNFRSNLSRLPTGTSLSNIQAQIRTSRTQGLRLVTVAPSQNEIVYTLSSTTARTLTLYHRYRREGAEEWIDGIPQGVRASGQTFNLTVGGRLYPNRRYEVEISDFDDYNPKLESTVDTPNFTIPGIRDPSLSFEQVLPTLRSILGLADFDMRTGELPAGYIEESNTEDAPSLVRDFGYLLAQRVGAGAFERSDGSWRFISKTLWAEQQVAANFTLDRFKITEATLRNELRDQLTISSASFYLWSFSKTDSSGDATGQQQARINPLPANFRKIALQIDNELSIPGYFVMIPRIPGNTREIAARLEEGVPLIVLADIQGALDEGVLPPELWTIEPGQNLTVELPHPEGTVTYTGTLMNKRVFGSNYGRLMQHRLTVWVHSAMLNTGQPFTWGETNWTEGGWNDRT